MPPHRRICHPRAFPPSDLPPLRGGRAAVIGSARTIATVPHHCQICRCRYACRGRRISGCHARAQCQRRRIGPSRGHSGPPLPRRRRHTGRCRAGCLPCPALRALRGEERKRERSGNKRERKRGWDKKICKGECYFCMQST